jgi:3-oxoacyl-[acyl-carrier protein] reductase
MARRIAVVTAAGGGIGRGVVSQLLAQRLAVVAVDRDASALDRLRSEPSGAAIYPIVADVTLEADVRDLFEAVARLGELQVLVNGVGSTCGGGLRDLSPTDWQRKFDLNLTSVFLCTRAALPLLEAASGDRAVIMLSSTLATVADHTTLAYGAFKAALEQFTRSLALELAPAGIRALAVAPGPVTATAGEAAYDAVEYARLNPLGRFATGDEIGAVIGFLASPSAAYITGAVVRVDGGDSALGAGWGPLQTLVN